MRSRAFALVYGVAVYIAFVAMFGVLIDFLGFGLLVPGIDARPASPAAVFVNGALVALFGISHSVMPRPWFKVRWARIVPTVIERSTYVLVTTVVLGALIWQWRSVPAPIWRLEQPALR